ncbi:MAG TPA: 30S ribosomal protein S8 [Candidatus Magasanikbacteria bacterium]|nr:30S ribosomal protein S8 [Candidatus Magasanikbacteria bacterium]
MMTDPIADMLTRIRNAHQSRKKRVLVPFSRVKFAIAQILKDQGYIDAVTTEEGMPKMLALDLKYAGGAPAITSITRESTPGHRMYRGAEELPKVLNGFGIAIVSTSHGIMTAKDAQKKGVGGEVLCSVY